jgi:hypothetical protein
VVDTLAVKVRGKITLAQQQRLAAVIHLCGAKRGEGFASRGFRLAPEERCGTQSLGRYLTQVDAMKKRFAKLKLAEPS